MNTNEKSSPRTLQEAVIKFSNPDACLEFLMPLVWPQGVTCPHCQAKDAHFIATRHIWRCKGCGKHFSIKVGTVMEDSALGLDKWLVAFWLIANAKNGISSHEVHRALGITQKSAWHLLHRIRLAMKTGSFRKMSGIVEADETYIGGKVQNFSKSKRAKLKAEATALKPPGWNVTLNAVVKKSIVAGILQRGDESGPSQVRAAMVEYARRSQLMEAIKANVEPGTAIMTDDLASYRRLNAEGYVHSFINHAITYAEGAVHTNGMENFWSLVKRTIRGTYIAVEPFHLEAYIDEQAWRFNNRKMTDGERFGVVLPGIAGKRLTYAELTGKTGTPVS